MNSTVLESLITLLPSISSLHVPGSKIYSFLKQVARKEVEGIFNDSMPNPKKFEPFGELVFPYQKMGAIDSLNLFDLDELIIFSFYWINRKRYRRVVDVGANIGLHSIILCKCGYEKIISYEPDPELFKILQRNLSLNSCINVQPFNAAISNLTSTLEFTRVLGNLTGSHLTGSKANPYGELERFPVSVIDIRTLIEQADLIKIDAEGHEKEILLATNRDHWLKTDALVEIENENNALVLFKHFNAIGVKLFSQKNNWRIVSDISNMPTSYRDGSLFVTINDEMPWEGYKTV